MDPLRILAVAVGLGMDAMSVCMAIGVRWHGPRQKFRLALHMGLAQFAMPILGWLVGKQFAGLLSDVGRYVAAALVFGVGVKMFYEALRSRPGAVGERIEHSAERELHVVPRDPTRGWSLVALAVATSIDALVVGFSLGVKGTGEGVFLVSIVIGAVAAMMALVGVALGRRIGVALGKPAELIGATVLIALAVSFLCI